MINKDEIIYCLTKDDVQDEAMYQIGRYLSDDEIILFKKRLEYGMGENMLFIYPAIFEEFKEVTL